MCIINEVEPVIVLVQHLWPMYVFARFESDQRKIVAVALLMT